MFMFRSSSDNTLFGSQRNARKHSGLYNLQYNVYARTSIRSELRSCIKQPQKQIYVKFETIFFY